MNRKVLWGVGVETARQVECFVWQLWRLLCGKIAQTTVGELERLPVRFSRQRVVSTDQRLGRVEQVCTTLYHLEI